MVDEGRPAAALLDTSGGDESERHVPHQGHEKHRDVSGGSLRPALFGATDGLVSNFSLISGVAGASVHTHTLVLTGLAGLVAGAFSMATGEYTSVRAQSEATLAEVAVEDAELRRSPAAEEAELAGVYRQRGLDPQLAREVARQLSRNHDTALRIHAQEELGVDIDRLPSPWVAAGSSFVSFSVGAALPLLPSVFGAHAFVVTLVVAAVALLLTGAVTSRFTSRTAAYSAVRQLLLGGAAAAVTYGVGHAVGAGIG